MKELWTAREYFECSCGSDEHMIKFTVDMVENEVYVHVFLDSPSFIDRLKLGLKYIFGYKCRYGHFGEWILRSDDIYRFKTMFDRYLKEVPHD